MLREKLCLMGCGDIEIFAKIENGAGLADAEAIIGAADVTVFARGDLGNNMDMWLLPAQQKRLAALCAKQGKPMVVATQLLSSMETSETPTRAEINDIFNCVIDGASGLMLTGETAAGKYPAQAMYFLPKTTEQALLYQRR